VKPLSTCFALLLFAVVLRADDTKPALKETLRIKDVQGGFAGFTGTQWTIEPSGEWTIATVFNRQLTEKAKGKLSAQQLAELGRELEKYKVEGLTSSGKPTTNPHEVTVLLGKKTATLILKPGERLPKADADSVEGRYAGIAQYVKQLLEKK
jgi:hypothetical protein